MVSFRSDEGKKREVVDPMVALCFFSVVFCFLFWFSWVFSVFLWLPLNNNDND